MTVALEQVPVVAATTPSAAVRSGEEYELVATAPHDLDAAAFATKFALPLTKIGRVEDGTGEVVMTHRGERVDLGTGYDHFSP